MSEIGEALAGSEPATPARGQEANSPFSTSPRLVRAAPLWRLLGPVRGYLIGCSILSALGAAAGLAPYIAIAEIARVALAAESVAAVSETIWTWVLIGIAGGALRLVLVFFSSRLGHYADAEILHDIRVKLVRRLGVFPIGWFRSVGSGAVKKVMTTDLEDMHQLIAHALGEIIGAAVAIIVGIGYLILVDWRMTAVTVAALLAWALFFKVAMRSMSLHLARLNAAEARISAASVEYADGITVVKTFGTGGRILERFAEAVREHTEAFRAWVDETRYSSAAARLLGSEMAVLAVVMVTGIWMISGDAMQAADLLPFLVVGIGLPTAIMPAVLGEQGLRRGRLAAGNIEDLLSRPGIPEALVARTPNGHRIEFDKVSFSYDGVSDAVSAVSAICEPGTLTALVGPSGAGKSTLASLVPRFYDVSAGAIRIGGTDIRAIPTPLLLSSMSLVFQDVILLRDTVRENIRIGRPDASDDDVRAAARAAQVDHVIERLPHGYDTPLGTESAGLSGGERQRLTIARAILSDAPIVILDEATAALDPDSESAVQAALAELTAGKTVLVIAHRLHTIAGAHQILVLDAGKVAERGTHAELIACRGLYARMWRAQQGGEAA
ncbi:ABC transporter ATP-binding protein [Nitratireductor pacificus]|uniref:ABC transporter n=1 Tax=Nitratireductor pacificus pht-3B TaxID=391937 RepID=K2M8R7_9HYPH|nr:ABC transporter ATP-binding protein [Nitratireductor pacificus]EKF18531.1 ABC transporter [Nitratireductor pacificus pht-3B]